MTIFRLGIITALLATAAVSCAPPPLREAIEEQPEAPARPDHWAQPIEGNPALPNLYKVTDGLYRGAQPEDEGFPELKKMGIKTVVNLRSVRSDRKECRESGLEYVKISVQAWEAEEEEVIDFLRIATDPAHQPVFVHCKHGADRTGMMCAIYRIVVQGWSKDEAIEEMTTGGYGFHKVWKNLVEYVRSLDVEAIQTSITRE